MSEELKKKPKNTWLRIEKEVLYKSFPCAPMPRFLLLSRTVLISSCINLCSFDVKAGKQTFPYYFTDMNFFPKKIKIIASTKTTSS